MHTISDLPKPIETPEDVALYIERIKVFMFVDHAMAASVANLVIDAIIRKTAMGSPVAQGMAKVYLKAKDDGWF